MKKNLVFVIIISGAFLSFLYLHTAGIQWPETISNISSNTGVNQVGPINAEAAVLLDQDGNIIFSKNAESRMYPASTTKILTALLAIENGDMDDIVIVGDEIYRVAIDGSKAGLYAGQEIVLQDLLYAMMLPSGNDAAYSLAVYVVRKTADDEDIDTDTALSLFTGMMNERARNAGVQESNFVNPDGYHDEAHYCTARDIALIAREAMQNELFREMVQTSWYPCKCAAGGIIEAEKQGGMRIAEKLKQITIRSCESSDSGWTNSNQLLQNSSPYYLAGANGIKTGYTSQAGYCLVSSVPCQDSIIIAVVLKSSETGVWQDSVSLLGYGLEKHTDGFGFLQQLHDKIDNDKSDSEHISIESCPNSRKAYEDNQQAA